MNLELQSPEIDKLVNAFIAAKQEFLPFKADAKGNWGVYVSIDGMNACTKDALHKHGVLLTQDEIATEFNGGTRYLITQLSHGNQFKRSIVPLYINNNPKDVNQAYGSSLSYQRRYALYGLFGIKGEDLDPDAIVEVKPIYPEPKRADKAQIDTLVSLIDRRNDAEAVKKNILSSNNITYVTELSSVKADQYIKVLSKE